ncbi:MAG: phosphate acyltransferase [Flavobacteriales bacterium]|nr:phosphate acyltransferase [Flavobacteriales bacterium]MCX7767635.1 phosphate acyltransferase [Flavobacteriales bacterium]MDW8409523.1 phosphate--acyl-ACP acyltransferase [Flavobacteriales bacterium]
MALNIGLDLFGGDYAPLCNLEGLKLVLERQPDIKVTVFGDEALVRPLTKEHPYKERIHIVHAPDKIDMGDSPMRSVISKPNSSIIQGLNYLKRGLIDGFASAGNTGAIFGASVIILGAVLENVRPCLMTHVPRPHDPDAIILDIGANADVKPETLADFALLGDAYCRHVLNIEQPRVALVNIGEEPEKGNELTKAAYRLFQQDGRFRFVGNAEPDKLFRDLADVYVCSGFAGNLILKLSEALVEIVKRLGFKHPYLDRFNYENLGGSPVLGVNGAVVIGHGISNASAIANMLLRCREIASSALHKKIKQAFQQA